MKNEVVFAAAGNGKTYDICRRAIELSKSTKKDILIITYTNEGKHSIEEEYCKLNFGIIDKNIIIKTWYSFLLSDLIKPYQTKLKLKCKRGRQELNINIPPNFINSIAFYEDVNINTRYKQTHLQYYLNAAKDIHKDNVSALAHKCVEESNQLVIKRLENIYDYIFIDEIQDYAGWDLEIIKIMFESLISVRCVGDFKQATFRTNNSRKNSKYRDDAIKDYFLKLQKDKLCTVEYSNVTRRFNKEICDFINTIHSDKESMVIPFSVDTTIENAGVYIIDSKSIDLYCKKYQPTILRYNKASKISFHHHCDVFNYGNSKGATFERVVIVPVSTVTPFIKEGKNISSKQTKSKFYVACTRAKHSVVFVLDNVKESNLFKRVLLDIDGEKINALKYCLS